MEIRLLGSSGQICTICAEYTVEYGGITGIAHVRNKKKSNRADSNLNTDQKKVREEQSYSVHVFMF